MVLTTQYVSRGLIGYMGSIRVTKLPGSEKCQNIQKLKANYIVFYQIWKLRDPVSETPKILGTNPII